VKGKGCGWMGLSQTTTCSSPPVQPCGWDLPQHPELQPTGAAGAEGRAREGAAG
jgi:hypothetical protein